jgi:hypothetical protein
MRKDERWKASTRKQCRILNNDAELWTINAPFESQRIRNTEHMLREMQSTGPERLKWVPRA